MAKVAAESRPPLSRTIALFSATTQSPSKIHPAQRIGVGLQYNQISLASELDKMRR
jgi:hypothetical protein